MLIKSKYLYLVKNSDKIQLRKEEKKMLEIILQKYFNLPDDWNDDYEKQDTIWYKSYNQLIQVIYDLNELCGLDTKIIDKLYKA